MSKPLQQLSTYVKRMDTALHQCQGHTTQSAAMVSRVLTACAAFGHCDYTKQMEQVYRRGADVSLIREQYWAKTGSSNSDLDQLLYRSEAYKPATEAPAKVDPTQKAHDNTNHLHQPAPQPVRQSASADSEPAQLGLFA